MFMLVGGMKRVTIIYITSNEEINHYIVLFKIVYTNIALVAVRG